MCFCYTNIVSYNMFNGGYKRPVGFEIGNYFTLKSFAVKLLLFDCDVVKSTKRSVNKPKIMAISCFGHILYLTKKKALIE